MSNATRSSQTHTTSHLEDNSRAGNRFLKLIVPLLLATLMFSGCARNYVITLNNGSMITAASKPKLKDNRYIYRNLEGGNSYVPAITVSRIAPASTVNDGNKTFRSTR